MAFVFSTLISIDGFYVFLTAKLQFNRLNINAKVQNIEANLSYAFRIFIEFHICRHVPRQGKLTKKQDFIISTYRI